MGKARSLPYSGAPERKASALPAIIRLGWKGLLGTNTLAYYKNLKTTLFQNDRRKFFVNAIPDATIK